MVGFGHSRVNSNIVATKTVISPKTSGTITNTENDTLQNLIMNRRKEKKSNTKLINIKKKRRLNNLSPDPLVLNADNPLTNKLILKDLGSLK